MAQAPLHEARALHEALALLAARDWQAAHGIVQEQEGPLAAWAHGIVHLVEDDLSNARYWYERAGRPFPAGRGGEAVIDAELAALAARLGGGLVPPGR
jgi:hypothetical protein